MADEFVSGRGRKHEDDYFRKKDAELVARLQAAATEARQREELGARIGVADPALVKELHDLGFTPDTVVLLPLMPIIEVAWAEGGVSQAERALIMELAATRGIAPGTVAEGQLDAWLRERPSAEVFTRAARLITAMVEAGAPTGPAPADLLEQCERIAAASGGVFGIGRISGEERAVIARISQALQSRP